MPILACIGISIVVYFLLSESMRGMQENEENIFCSNCSGKIKSIHVFCPHCKEKIKEECKSCKKLIDINWRYCPYCGDTKENR